MEQHPISRRGYLGATGVLLAGSGLAGCITASGAGNLTESDDFSVDATFELNGDGPGDPVTVSVAIDDTDFERTLHPDEEFETDMSTSHGEVEIELEYEEEVEVELEWSRTGLELEIDIEQTRWDHTAGTVEISLAGEELSTVFDGSITLPESTTEITGTDTRTIEPETEYEIEIDLSVEDDEVEGEFEIEWDNGEDDDEEEDSDDDDDENDD